MRSAAVAHIPCRQPWIIIGVTSLYQRIDLSTLDMVKSSLCSSLTLSIFRERKQTVQTTEARRDIKKRTFRYFGSNLLLHIRYPAHMTYTPRDSPSEMKENTKLPPTPSSVLGLVVVELLSEVEEVVWVVLVVVVVGVIVV